MFPLRPTTRFAYEGSKPVPQRLIEKEVQIFRMRRRDGRKAIRVPERLSGESQREAVSSLVPLRKALTHILLRIVEEVVIHGLAERLLIAAL